MQPRFTAIRTHTLRRLLLVALPVTLLVKVWLATRLELYSDEIFYWLASTYPALAYSDLPFMTALLAGLGSMAAEHSPLAVRSLFLGLGTTIPLLVVWIARPLHGERQSWQAGLLTLCLPLLLLMGLLAVPDVPLIVLGLLAIGLTERATREDRPGQWITLGAVVALGMSTHYRFILFPAAIALFLVLSPTHRHLWRTPRLWCAGLIGALGLYPSAAFNLGNELSGLDYHLVSRHPWSFQTEGLLHLPTQAVIVTPLLYALLLFTLVLLWREAVRGNHRSLLMALFATLPIAVFGLLAPWADTTRTTLHWPLSGYLPLLAFAPRALHSVGGWLQQRLATRSVRRCLMAVPATGLIGGVLTMAAIGSQGFNTELQQWVDAEQLSNKMAGWRPLANELEQLARAGTLPPLVVTDNYYTAAQLRFYLQDGQGPEILTIDRDKAIRDGRLAQLRLWNLHETKLLEQHSGSRALFITEDSTLNVEEKRALLRRACSLFEPLHYRQQWRLLDGLKSFSAYDGIVTSGASSISAPRRHCPMPSYAWLDEPAPGSTHHDTISVAGWAYNDGNGIQAMTLLLDGQSVASLTRTIPRPDVVELTDAGGDPQAPVVGFQSEVPVRELTGNTVLELEVISRDGERQTFGRRMIRLASDEAAP